MTRWVFHGIILSYIQTFARSPIIFMLVKGVYNAHVTLYIHMYARNDLMNLGMHVPMYAQTYFLPEAQMKRKSLHTFLP